MSVEKQLLPSISQFLGLMPEISINKPVATPIPESIPNKIIGSNNSTFDERTTEFHNYPNIRKGRENIKTVYFTPAEDLTLFKTLFAYYGAKPIFKVPWSFWDLYRRTTGSNRSDSSLYHHWNGSIIKKYGKLLKDGNIEQCIRLAEAELFKKRPPENVSSSMPIYTTMNGYRQPFPSSGGQIMFEASMVDVQRPLIHFSSLPVFSPIIPQN